MAEKVQVDFPEGINYQTALLLIAWKIVERASSRPNEQVIDEQYIKDTTVLFQKVRKTLYENSLTFIEEETKK